MIPQGKRHKTVPVALGGMYTAGDPSTLSDGMVTLLQNYVFRPNRIDGRAPFIYDGLDTVSGFAIWQDMVNELTKTVAVRSSDQKIYTKNTSGSNYTAGVSGIPSSTRLTSYTNFLQKLYMMFDNGSGVPSAVASWDGTTLVTAPFNSTFVSRAIAAYNERLFFVNPRVTFTLAQTSATTNAYDWSSGNWAKTNVTVQNNTNASGITVGRLVPTSTAVSGCKIIYNTTSFPTAGLVAVAASTSELKYVWRSDIRSTDASYQVPLTLELVLVLGRSITASFAYVVGDLISNIATDGNMHRYRCTTAGNLPLAVPAVTLNAAGTTVDGTVTWTEEGSDVLSAYELYLPTLTDTQNFTTSFVSASVPARTNQVTIAPRIKFYNTLTTALTQLVAVEMAYRDSITDGDPRKANFGQQITAGDFYYPFFNQESSATATVNMDAVIWSEIDNPKSILAANTYPLTEIAGLGTAACVAGGLLWAFKRRGMWRFRGQADINEPILPQTAAIQVGCLGPLALDVSRDDEVYWIGENHVYRMKADDAQPTEIDSPGMFETIMSRGSSWVESQSTYNLPILRIDHANKDVWVYTQKGSIYVYSIQYGSWSVFTTNPTGTAAEVNGLVFDPVSNRMLVSFGGASATRFDETSDAQDSIVTGGGTPWNVQNIIVPKPFELYAARYEATLLEVGLFNGATILQGSLTLSYSYDRGSTYTTPTGYPITSWPLNNRIRMPLAATGPSVTIKLSRTGAGGARNWSVSKADALLRVHRGELSYTNAT